MNNNKIDIGDAINETFEIYKKIAVTGGLGFMAIMIILMAFIGIGIGAFIDLDKFSETMKTFNPDTLSIQGKLIYIGIVVLFSVLISPFNAGMQKIAEQADKNEAVEFSSLFKYVNSKYYVDIILFSSILVVITVGCSMVLKDLLPNFIGSALGFIISFFTTTVTFIGIPLIIFKEMNFIDALKNSVSNIMKQFFIVLLLIILGELAAFIGIFLFCFGIFFTFPFYYAMQYVIYKKITQI